VENNRELYIFLAAFIVSGLSGLAALLRSKAPLDAIGIGSALLNSALLGLGVCLVWFPHFHESPGVLIGICLLMGLGGTPMLEYVLKLMARGGVNINMRDDSLTIDNKHADHTESTKSKDEA
jgi:hypothetical protein